MKTLDAFTAEAKINYDGLKQQSLGTVKRWVYASMGIYRFGPVPDEAVGMTRGRVVKDEKQARTKYGFDARERIVYERSGTSTCYAEYFRIYESGTVFQVSFFCAGQATPQLQAAQQLILDAAGTAVELRNGDNPTSPREHYIWRDGNLVRIDYANTLYASVTEIEYDLTGQVTKVWRGSGKQRQLYFKRPPKNVTIPMLERKIKDVLPVEIREALLRARSKIKSPIYCIALAYDGEGNGVLPPHIGVGLESERQNWLKTHGREAKYSIWNPAEFTHYEKPHIQMANGKLQKDMEVYSQLLEAQSGSDSRPIKMLNEVALALAKVDWSKDFETTDDFVVYCVDFELGELSKNLKKTASLAVLNKLNSKGLL